MKKFLSFLLILSVLFGCLTCAVQAAEPFDLKIAVTSDLHYCTPRVRLEGPDQGPNKDDPMFWYADSSALLADESGFIIDEFLNRCADSECAYVLIAGDLAENGRTARAAHEAVAAKLAAFEKKTGKDVFVINGEHDIGMRAGETTMHDFMKIYADFGFNQAVAMSDTDCSYAADLGDNYRLIAVDSCDHGKIGEDGMSSDQLDFVKHQASAAKREGRHPIVMMHHNLLDHIPQQRIVNQTFSIRNSRSTAARFANWGIRVVLSGHEHCSDVTSYISSSGNKIYDFANTALTSYPLAYRVMTFTDKKIQYDSVTLKTIDTDALQRTVDGYSAEQLNAMRTDVNAYAKGFLKAGVQYRLWFDMSQNKMGIDQADLYYDAADMVFYHLDELLSMPIYRKDVGKDYKGDVLEDMADMYNIVIPYIVKEDGTPYKNGWDLVTELAAMHYAGEEKYSLEGVEVTAFLRITNAILRDDLSKYQDSTLLQGANALLKREGNSGLSQTLTRLSSHVFGSAAAREYFILALISPFLYEFVYDSDGVNDSKGSIEGYTVHNRMANIAENIREYFRSLWAYIRNFFVLTSIH